MGRTSHGVLERRKTHTYVGTYSYLDKWDEYGDFTVEGSRNISMNEEQDRRIDLLTVRVTIRDEWRNLPRDEVRKALEDTFTSVGCACSHDCCGCRSRYARARALRPGPRPGGLWAVQVTTYSNY